MHLMMIFTCRFDKLMDELNYPVYTDDYDTAPLLRPTPVKPTQSVVELPKLRDLAAPDPKQLANTKHTLGDAGAVQVQVEEAVNPK